MYPKPWYKSKTLWLAVAQGLTTAITVLSFVVKFGLIKDPTTLALVVTGENFLGAVLQFVNRFFTVQPVTL